MWFRPLLVTVLTLCCTACEGKKSTTYSSSSGTLALSSDDALLYVVDTDNEAVLVVDTKTFQVLETVKVGKSPRRIFVGQDDTVYVANTGSRSVSLFRRGDWQNIHTLNVGVEPVGLGVSADNQTLYVVNSTSLTSAQVGSLQAFDLSTLQPKWEMEVGEEPRDLVVLPNDTALVSLSRQGDIATVDLLEQKVTKPSTRLYEKLNATRIRAESFSPEETFSSFRPRAVNELAATPDGTRIFAPAILAREDAIARPPNAFGGYYAAGGPCNLGSVAASGVLTFEHDGTPLVDDLTACQQTSASGLEDFPGTQLSFNPPDASMTNLATQGPSAMAVDVSGNWLFVVNRESNNVVVMPTKSRNAEGVDFSQSGTSVRGLPVPVGRGPDGIALSKDGMRAYVYSQFDHRLDVLTAEGEGPSSRLVSATAPVILAQDVLPHDVVEGRKLFFNAIDNRMSADGTHVACSTCHLDGREDGHVWHFNEGLRQTPSLAGRAMGQTAPYHWGGEFSSMDELMSHTVNLRMGGSGLDSEKTRQVLAYIDSLSAPDNPHRSTDGTLTEKQMRGKAVFEKAACDSCHSGAYFTNNGQSDVGTLDATSFRPGTLNTPSLLGLARTAPYLHDGSAETLKARILRDKNSNSHGMTKALTDAEVEALVAYLESL